MTAGPAADPAPAARARRAFLAAKRDELLTPVQAIVDVAGQLLDEGRSAAAPRFAEDMRRLHGAGVELGVLIREALSASRLESVSDESEFQELRTRLRHEMLNKLNPVINYSEMWLEDGADHFPPELNADLALLCRLGRRCLALLDTILAARDFESTIVAGAAPDLARIEEMITRMTGLVEQRPPETGRLLVVDDNEINRDILRRLLETQGHSVALAADGRQALDFLAHQPCDLVLLDIVMPEMDGFEVLLRLKSDARLRDVPVIMISALNEIDYVVSCIKLGAEDYLNRPYNPLFLKARIGACLEKKRLREREILHLAEIDRERRRADELLHVILPPPIVAELKATNAVVPRRYEAVAVLFADIVDFTPFCERHSPEDVLQHLQQLVEIWEELAVKFEVQKIKTIGDAFMAACGLLTPVESPVLNCLRFGLEMIAAAREQAAGWDLRVGIHYGQVVAGVLGRRQYLFDMFGDAVNTAARMESHGVQGAVVLSGEAWSQIEHQCTGTQLDPIPVKGKGVVLRFRFDGWRV